MAEKKYRYYLLLSLMVIIGTIIWSFTAMKNLPKVDYSFGDWHGNAVLDGHVYTISDEIKNSGTPVDFLWGPFDSLKKGSYTVHIEYDAEEDQSCMAAAVRMSKAPLIRSSKGILSKNLDGIDYQFEAKDDIDEFLLTIQYNGAGSFSVSDIVLKSNNTQIKRNAASIIIGIILADILVYLFHKYKKERLTILGLIGVFLLASLPLGIKGIYFGHDAEIHLLRIEAIVQALRSGQFPARVSSMVLFGYGYPFSIYYNDIFLYIPAIFRLLGFSITGAYKIYVLFINLFKVLIAYFSFKQISGQKRNALIMTLLFATASYRLTNLYVRAAAGEYTAQIFLPLLGLAIKRIFFDNSENKKGIFLNAVVLAAAMSGFISAHIPTTVMSCFILFLVCIFFWWKTIRKKTILTLGCAFLLTAVLNLYYIVPMADYYFNVPTTISGEVDSKTLLIQDYGVYPAQLFGFFQSVSGTADGDGPERLQATPGPALMIAFFWGIYLLFKEKCSGWLRFTLLFSFLTLLMASCLFPWDWLTLHIPGWRVLVQMIQFPWRLFEYSVLFLTLLTGEILVIPNTRSLSTVLCAGSVVIVFWFSSSLFDSADILFFYDTASIRVNWIGNEEQYILQGSDPEKISKKVISEGIDSVEILSRKSDRVDVLIKANEESGAHYVVLPLYNYKGYHVTDEQGMEYEIINGEQNRIAFELPNGFEGKVTAAFRDPSYWTAALLISLLGLAAVSVGMVYSGRKKSG